MALDITVPKELQDLGVSKIISGKENKIPCLYLFNGSAFVVGKTTKELKSELVDSGDFGDKDNVKKIMYIVAQIWLDIKAKGFDDGGNGSLSSYEQRRTQHIESVNAEIAKVKAANIGVTFEEWQTGLTSRVERLRSVISENMPGVWDGLEFELSTLRISNIADCTLPFIGIILGRPSGYKTVIVDRLKDWPFTFHTDKFSPRSWITHTSALETEEDLQRVDMLPKVKDRHFLTPELAPLFTSRDDELAQSIGDITKLADGRGFGSDSGAHGHREYGPTMFVWTGAAVDIPYKVYKLLAGLGFKIYFYRLPYSDREEKDLLADMSEDFNKKLDLVDKALLDYLIWFEICPKLKVDESTANGLRKIEWDFNRDDIQAKKWIVKNAILLKHLRAIAKTWGGETRTPISDPDDGGEVSPTYSFNYSISQLESPERAIQILRNIARGHALALYGRNYITLEDITVAVKTALSTALIDRIGVLRLLIEHSNDLNASRIMSALNVSKPTALRTMTELKAISLVEMYQEKNGRTWQNVIKLKDCFSWLRSEEFKAIRQGFEPVDNREFMTRKTNSPHSGSENKDDSSTFDCGYCSVSCSSRYDFKRHLAEVHGKQWDDQNI
jgi:hypothetical protein